MQPALRIVLAGVVGLALGMSCAVTLRDDMIFSCTSDADCGGDGYVCNAPAGGAGSCCKATGAEVCGDGIDNDCNGKIDADDAWPAETCNGVDDNCDGRVDEGFDLRNDPTNCGTCGTTCDAATESCQGGECKVRGEFDCGDGIDNDGNDKTDCEDLACNLLPCGTGCLCQGLRKTERLCSDGVDNDGDGDTDCADSDCLNIACGVGCVCQGGVKRETDCSDGVDNDGDGDIDCNDDQCAGQICAPGTTQRCSGTACLCNGGSAVAETGLLCADGIDNDCNNLLDCQQASCDGLPCVSDGGVALDGGPSCLCGAGRKQEQHCADRRDNDDDGLTDCADVMDCPAGTPCTALVGPQIRTGNCGATSMLCDVELCTDGMDNDGDGLIDCLDPDCEAFACTTMANLPDGGPACQCVGGVKVERNCQDNLDNDGDTQTDCADMDCDMLACNTGTAPDGGPACRCVTGIKKEMNCRDRVDNDGDNLVDCADLIDCPQGTACTRGNGSAGTCQANGNCN